MHIFVTLFGARLRSSSSLSIRLDWIGIGVLDYVPKEGEKEQYRVSLNIDEAAGAGTGACEW